MGFLRSVGCVMPGQVGHAVPHGFVSALMVMLCSPRVQPPLGNSGSDNSPALYFDQISSSFPLGLNIETFLLFFGMC